MTDAVELAVMQREFARRVSALDPDDASAAAGIEARLRSDCGIPAEVRVGVYANAYFARIHDVLKSDFAALHASLGDDAFHDLARLYLMAHPSRTFSLRFAGERLADFLAGPIAEFFSRRWPFAADLARLEWALVDVFDAADAASLDRATLSAIPPDAWAGLSLAFVPSHRVLELAWPVQHVLEARSTGAALPAIELLPTTILVHRQDDHVFQRALTPTEAHAIALVGEGHDFGAICAELAEATDEASGARQMVAFLERWLAEGLLRKRS